MNRYELTRTALADLDELWLYIAADNVDAADRVSHAILDACELLAQHPLVGPVATSPHVLCSSGRAGVTCSSTHQRPRRFASLPSCTAHATWPRSSAIATDIARCPRGPERGRDQRWRSKVRTRSFSGPFSRRWQLVQAPPRLETEYATDPEGPYSAHSQPFPARALARSFTMTA